MPTKLNKITTKISISIQLNSITLHPTAQPPYPLTMNDETYKSVFNKPTVMFSETRYSLFSINIICHKACYTTDAFLYGVVSLNCWKIIMSIYATYQSI